MGAKKCRRVKKEGGEPTSGIPPTHRTYRQQKEIATMVLRSIFAGGWNGESELRSKSASVCERGGGVALTGWDTAESPVLASERQRRIFNYSHGGRGSNILQTRSIAGYFSSARVGAGWLARFTSSRTLGAQGRSAMYLALACGGSYDTSVWRKPRFAGNNSGRKWRSRIDKCPYKRA